MKKKLKFNLRKSPSAITLSDFRSGMGKCFILSCTIKKLKFDKKGLIPAIIQDYKTGTVLMLAYMNLVSLKKTLRLDKTCFWSRKRLEYWIKGETSGNYQFVKSIAYDCDMDALLIKVRQVGVACHTGNKTCFYRRIV